MIELRYVPHTFGPFNRFGTYPTTLVYGFHYVAALSVPFDEQKRMVRVWLPGSYDFVSPKKHPVLYMADGQNMVDKVLTEFGDWHLDKVMMRLQKEGLPEPILVGIDSPKDATKRSNELNPPYPVLSKVFKRPGAPDHPIGDQFVGYIINELKPLIDSLFSTNPSREYTGIGGSSMGGIMAFYAFMSRPDIFGYTLAFSPPLFFYSKGKLQEFLDEFHVSPATHGRLTLFVGGQGFERQFTDSVAFMERQLRNRGFDERAMRCYIDPEAEHHEEWWYRYSDPAIRFWVKGLPE